VNNKYRQLIHRYRAAFTLVLGRSLSLWCQALITEWTDRCIAIADYRISRSANRNPLHTNYSSYNTADGDLSGDPEASCRLSTLLREAQERIERVVTATEPNSVVCDMHSAAN